ncbi:hypothetical protein ACRAWD_24700 [Caulobacter segnis]
MAQVACSPATGYPGLDADLAGDHRPRPRPGHQLLLLSAALARTSWRSR